MASSPWTLFTPERCWAPGTRPRMRRFGASDPVELIRLRLGKDMVVASPSASVSTSTRPWRRHGGEDSFYGLQGETPTTSAPATLAKPEPKRAASFAYIVRRVIFDGDCDTKARVAANAQGDRRPEGYPTTPARPPVPAKSIAAPKTLRARRKARRQSGGARRPLIVVIWERLQLKPYDCESCHTVVFVGQRICFGCNRRLKRTTSFSSSQTRFFLPQYQYPVLRSHRK